MLRDKAAFEAVVMLLVVDVFDVRLLVKQDEESNDDHDSLAGVS